MPELKLDILVSLALLAAVAWLALRQGRANPVSTGKLARRVHALDSRLSKNMDELSTRMSVVEVNTQQMRRDLDDAPTKADIARLEERMAGLALQMKQADEAASRQLASTDNAVIRIEQLLLNRSLPPIDGGQR